LGVEVSAKVLDENTVKESMRNVALKRGDIGGKGGFSSEKRGKKARKKEGGPQEDNTKNPGWFPGEPTSLGKGGPCWGEEGDF